MATIYTRDEEVYNKLVSAFEQQKVSQDNTIKTDLTRFARRIDTDFDFEKIEEAEGYSFNEYLVEQLLDQASDLLDRALRQRGEWDRLSKEWVELHNELKEYIELNEIHKNEIDAGRYTFPATNALHEFYATSVDYGSFWGYKEAKKKFNLPESTSSGTPDPISIEYPSNHAPESIDIGVVQQSANNIVSSFSDTSERKLNIATRFSAWASHVVAYYLKAPDQEEVYKKWNYFKQFKQNILIDGTEVTEFQLEEQEDFKSDAKSNTTLNNDSNLTGEGEGFGVDVEAQKHAVRSFKHSFDLRNFDYSVQYFKHIFSAESTRLRAMARKAVSDWEGKNKEFKIKRVRIAQNFQDLKLETTTEEDGVFNIPKRLEPLQRRCVRDLADAVARLEAASQGIEAVYGPDMPIGTLPAAAFGGAAAVTDEGKTLSSLDACVGWARDATQLIIRFAQRDQSVIFPVSLLGVLGERKWSGGRDRGEWTLDLTEAFPQDLIHIRLRGLSATIKDEGPDNLWQLRVQAPAEAMRFYARHDPKKKDQDPVREVLIGRATGWTSQRAPDVVGAAALHNLSPLGKWVVRVENWPGSPQRRKLQDITLHLHCAYQLREA